MELAREKERNRVKERDKLWQVKKCDMREAAFKGACMYQIAFTEIACK